VESVTPQPDQPTLYTTKVERGHLFAACRAVRSLGEVIVSVDTTEGGYAIESRKPVKREQVPFWQKILLL
jgi:hypothetical protein